MCVWGGGGGGVRGSARPFLGHVVGFLTLSLGPKLDPLQPFSTCTRVVDLSKAKSKMDPPFQKSWIRP